MSILKNRYIGTLIYPKNKILINQYFHFLNLGGRGYSTNYQLYLISEVKNV